VYVCVCVCVRKHEMRSSESKVLCLGCIARSWQVSIILDKTNKNDRELFGHNLTQYWRTER